MMSIPTSTWLFLFLLIVFWLWESKAPFFTWQQAPAPTQYKRYQHGTHNLAITLFNALISAALFASAIAMAASTTQEYGIGFLNWVAVQFPEPVVFILAIVLMDGWIYLWHRANHTIPFLWRFHRMHHSDPYMDCTSATRFHIGELAFSTLLRMGVILILGLSPQHILVYGFLMIACTLFHHANISLGSFDPILRKVIVTPDMHKIHHSNQIQETNSNYGTVFSFWDRLGKSYRETDKPEGIVFGVEGLEEEQGFWRMMRTPFK